MDSWWLSAGGMRRLHAVLPTGPHDAHRVPGAHAFLLQVRKALSELLGFPYWMGLPQGLKQSTFCLGMS